MADKIKILTFFENISGGHKLENYKKHGGYKALEKTLKTDPIDIIKTIKNSGLRGRGGAGFPTGLKLSFVPQGNDIKKYIVCNNDEGEPGTFKDRYICVLSPHMIIEGMIIAAYAIGASKGYIYTRYEFHEEIDFLKRALDEAYQEKLLGNNILNSGFDFDLDHYTGAGAYICGEETGLLSSLEGKKGQPKLKPPFPAISGYLGKPTLVNNTETLASIPWIIINGSDNYKSIGTEKSPGTKLFSISGPLNKPGVYELPLGYSLEKLINEDAGGLIQNKKLKACIPGGLSAPILTDKEIIGLKLDYESIADAGSMLGSGGVMVIDQDQSIIEILDIVIQFFHHESCGQCTPCREGTGWMYKIMKSVLQKNADKKDIEKIYNIANHMSSRTICALSDAAAMPIKSIITKFKDEIYYYLSE